MNLSSSLEAAGLTKLNMAVALSVIIAMILSVVPIPLVTTPFWPEWVVLTMIYWCIALPDRYNAGFACLCGFMMDLLHGSIIGQHMLACIVVVSLAILLHRHFRLCPVWQQALIVGILLIPYFLLILWIHNFLYPTSTDWRYWTPLLSGIVLWPWVFSVLRLLRYKASQIYEASSLH